MTDAIAAPLIDGQGIPVELRDVEAELARLWGPAALELGEPEPASAHVTRSRTGQPRARVPGPGRCRRSNRCWQRSWNGFPAGRSCFVSRTTLLERSRPRSRRCAICHHRANRKFAPSRSCCEPDRTRSTFFRVPCDRCWRPTCRTCSGGRATPGSIRALFHDLAQACSRLVLDLSDRCTDAAALRVGLDESHGTSSHDSVWFGLARWRELVAQFFDGPGHGEKLATD